MMTAMFMIECLNVTLNMATHCVANHRHATDCDPANDLESVGVYMGDIMTFKWSDTSLPTDK